MKRHRKHCGGMNCEDSYGHTDNSCECTCDDCTTCTCGCATAEPGFDQSGARGIWVGRGAGYQLVKLTVGWDVLDPEGVGLSLPEDQRPQMLDEANALATKHAREAGHGHP